MWAPKAQRPVARKPFVSVSSGTQATADNKGDVLCIADESVGLQERLVLVLEGVVTSRAPARPLDDKLETGEVAAHLEHGIDCACGAGLKRNEVEAGALCGLHDVPQLLKRRDACSDRDGLQRLSLQGQLFDEGKLKAPQICVEIKEVDCDPCTRRDAQRQLPHLLCEMPWERNATPCELSMVTRALCSSHLLSMGPRCHSWHHDRWAANKPCKLGDNVPNRVEPRREAMHPGSQRRQPGGTLLQEQGQACNAILRRCSRGGHGGVCHHGSIAPMQEPCQLGSGEGGAHVEHVARL
mmetsp:Transcript_38991/g.93543  ORF Transcript_38991/g.93543 Transcript_38991/m.93543 type:complete len:296 (-) Transcript_38991:339-1226(-)